MNLHSTSKFIGTFIKFILGGNKVDTRIPFVKHAWRLAYKEYQTRGGKRNRKRNRASMRAIAATLVQFIKEAR